MKAQRDRRGASGVGRALLVGVCVFAALVLLGVALGPLWWWLAPRAEVTALGEGNVFPGASQDVFAAEGYFVLITAVAGIVTGYACYMVQFPLAGRRMQDLRLPVLVASFLGAVVATVLVWRVGVALDASVHEAVLAAEPGDTVISALRLQATAFLVAWPFVHVLQYGLLDGISLLRSDQPGVPEPAVSEPEPVPPEDGAGPPIGAGGPGVQAANGQVSAPPATDTEPPKTSTETEGERAEEPEGPLA